MNESDNDGSCGCDDKYSEVDAATNGDDRDELNENNRDRNNNIIGISKQ